MKYKTIVLVCLIIQSHSMSAQKYFELFYTNIQEAHLKDYMNAYIYAQAWLSTGEYIQNCDRCTRLSPRGLIKNEMIDSIGHVYTKVFPKELYKSEYIPSEYYFLINHVRQPYIIRTLYKIIGNKAIIIFQTRITFDKTDNKESPEVYDIYVYTDKYSTVLQDALVLDLYRKKLKMDKIEASGPPVRN